MLELRNINFYTEDGKKILDDINLKIDGRFTAITGPNGSGKSTLAKLIAGIIQPSDGQILFNGEDITNLSITERARKGISYAFQQPVRFKGLRVRDLMEIALGKDSNFKEICNILSEVGLCAKDYVNREIDGSLSGGELKRIEIAMIMARATELSLFDEPEAGIDLWSFQKLIHVFQKMYEKNKGNILIISHQERILSIAEKIIYLKDGKVEKYDTREKILPEILKSTEDSFCKVLTDKMEVN